MIYLLILTLIQPGIKIVGNAKQQIFLVNSPEDASIISWQNVRALPVGYDLEARLYKVDIKDMKVEEISLKKIEFKAQE